jgi:ABC-type ATPase involved in cell division
VGSASVKYAIAGQPNLLSFLMDEPTRKLSDGKTSEEIMKLLMTFMQGNTVMI